MAEFTGERVIPGQVDADLWNVHLAMVQQAQTNRTEMLKTAAALLGSLKAL